MINSDFPFTRSLHTGEMLRRYATTSVTARNCTEPIWYGLQLIPPSRTQKSTASPTPHEKFPYNSNNQKGTRSPACLFFIHTDGR